MKTTRLTAVFALAAGMILSALAPSVATAATATALVSATVLGPAGDETANGAVTLSRIAETVSPVELPGSGRSQSPTLARFRVGGGSNATFAVSLPDTLVVSGRGTQSGSGFQVNNFRAAGAGRLGSDGTSTIAIAADVRVPAGQAPGAYAGSFPVTIAYN